MRPRQLDRPAGPPKIHLFRGAPAVRDWSKHQATVQEWTLCGVDRTDGKSGRPCVEDAAEVTCPYCLDLMRPSQYRRQGIPSKPESSAGGREDANQRPPSQRRVLAPEDGS